jgi:hypothetical protein
VDMKKSLQLTFLFYYFRSRFRFCFGFVLVFAFVFVIIGTFRLKPSREGFEKLSYINPTPETF